ncbi:GATA zinc finger domain-containing protein 14-like isoform X2 [Adelges cooleyi]|uniref:GATA zinc finger domain-containing protein 14-like isoform X2 n=1 Tax=Adelges cooleyi TaxID=133065 RepID=UPI00217F679C|nr:GATA zinc finger domain-containing protein 14-like isoform X2 [Adelges cooleyi]
MNEVTVVVSRMDFYTTHSLQTNKSINIEETEIKNIESVQKCSKNDNDIVDDTINGHMVEIDGELKMLGSLLRNQFAQNNENNVMELHNGHDENQQISELSVQSQPQPDVLSCCVPFESMINSRSPLYTISDGDIPIPESIVENMDTELTNGHNENQQLPESQESQYDGALNCRVSSSVEDNVQLLQNNTLSNNDIQTRNNKKESIPEITLKNEEKNTSTQPTVIRKKHSNHQMYQVELNTEGMLNSSSPSHTDSDECIPTFLSAAEYMNTESPNNYYENQHLSGLKVQELQHDALKSRVLSPVENNVYSFQSNDDFQTNNNSNNKELLPNEATKNTNEEATVKMLNKKEEHTTQNLLFENSLKTISTLPETTGTSEINTVDLKMGKHSFVSLRNSRFSPPHKNDEDISCPMSRVDHIEIKLHNGNHENQIFSEVQVQQSQPDVLTCCVQTFVENNAKLLQHKILSNNDIQTNSNELIGNQTANNDIMMTEIQLITLEKGEQHIMSIKPHKSAKIVKSNYVNQMHLVKSNNEKSLFESQLYSRSPSYHINDKDFPILVSRVEQMDTVLTSAHDNIQQLSELQMPGSQRDVLNGGISLHIENNANSHQHNILVNGVVETNNKEILQNQTVIKEFDVSQCLNEHVTHEVSNNITFCANEILNNSQCIPISNINEKKRKRKSSYEDIKKAKRTTHKNQDSLVDHVSRSQVINNYTPLSIFNPTPFISTPYRTTFNNRKQNRSKKLEQIVSQLQTGNSKNMPKFNNKTVVTNGIISSTQLAGEGCSQVHSSTETKHMEVSPVIVKKNNIRDIFADPHGNYDSSMVNYTLQESEVINTLDNMFNMRQSGQTHPSTNPDTSNSHNTLPRSTTCVQTTSKNSIHSSKHRH